MNTYAVLLKNSNQEMTFSAEHFKIENGVITFYNIITTVEPDPWMKVDESYTGTIEVKSYTTLGVVADGAWTVIQLVLDGESE